MELEVTSTGGGFNALYMPHPLGRYQFGFFLITNSLGEQPPIKGEKCIISWYTNDAEFLGTLDIDKWHGFPS